MSNTQLGLKRLLYITGGCRPDMHEPDEQGVKCRVIGDHLDNAFGEHIAVEPIIKGYQEYVVVMERLMDGKIVTQKFNLANLIALARQAPDQPSRESGAKANE